MARKIRILVADDHPALRQGLTLLLNNESDIEVVGQASDGVEAFNMIFDLVPDLVLIDWKMPKISGLHAAKLIKENMAAVKTMLYSGHPIDDHVFEALDNYLNGFIPKSANLEGLLHGIRQVFHGNDYLSPDVHHSLLEYRARKELRQRIKLSPREKEVLGLMATSLTYKEIALQLSISETTVTTHVKRMFQKLGQPNRTQAVLAGIRLGFIPPQ